jgi:hypothetical protein
MYSLEFLGQKLPDIAQPPYIACIGCSSLFCILHHLVHFEFIAI